MYGKIYGYSSGGGAGSMNWADIINRPTNLETTQGAQIKADQAETNAKTYADSLIAGIQAGEITWESILYKPTDFETTTGSQTKATLAETNAKSYADSTKLSLTGGTMTGPIKRNYPSIPASHYENLAMYTTPSLVEGSMKITTPKEMISASLNISIKGGISSGSDSSSWELSISGSTANRSLVSGWRPTQSMLTGQAPFENVYVGYDGEKLSIFLGENNTQWAARSYIHVEEFNVFQQDDLGWEAGWTIAPITNLDTITTKILTTMNKIANVSYVDQKIVGLETVTGAQTKANAAESNAKAYTDTKIAGITPGTGGGSGSGTLDLKTYGVINDGTSDDTVGLKAYIADMISKNKPIYIPGSANKYIITDQLLFQSPVTIYGDGDRTWIHSTIEDKAPIKFLNTSNCIIRDLKVSSKAVTRTSSFQGAITFHECSHMLGENLTIDGAAATGYFITGSSNIKISNNRVMNTLADGIHTTSGSKNVIITENHCVNCGDDSISVVAYQSQGVRSDGVIISNNVVIDGKARGITNIGGSAVKISNNVINGTASCGILSHRDGNPAYNTYASLDTTIMNNTIKNAGSVLPNVGNQNGIELGESDLTKVIANTVDGSKHRGIVVLSTATKVELDNNDSSNNTIAGYLLQGVGLNAGINRAYNNGEQGFLIQNLSFSSFTSLISYDSATVITLKHNIHIEGCNNLVIGDCISLDTRSTQRIERAFYMTSSTNVKHGNVIFNKGTRPVTYTNSCSGIDATKFTIAEIPTTAIYFNIFKIGQMVINSANSQLYMWNGTAWVTLVTS